MKAAADQGAWEAAAVAFDALIAARDGVRVRDTAGPSFDWRLIEAIVDTVPVRLVRDRGDIRVELRDADGEWQFDRNLLGMWAGLPAEDVVRSTGPAVSEAFARWDDLRAALRSPRLRAYSDLLETAAWERLSERSESVVDSVADAPGRAERERAA